MEQKLYTVRGLKLLSITFFTLILWELLTQIFFLFSYANDIVSPYLDYGPYILLFLAMITFFLGIFLIWGGRSEIGNNHINSVETGLWIIIILLATASISGMFLDRTIWNSLSFFIANLMMMLVSFYFLKNIANKRIRNIIWIAIFMFVILNPLIPIIMYVMPNDYYIYLYRFILQILSLVIPYILLAICYYKTYKVTKKES